MRKTLTMLEDKLCRDIEESMREEKITPATMEMLDKAVDIIKDISTIEAMEEYGEWNEDNYRRYRGHDYMGHDYMRNDYRKDDDRMSDHEIAKIRRIVNQM